MPLLSQRLALIAVSTVTILSLAPLPSAAPTLQSTAASQLEARIVAAAAFAAGSSPANNPASAGMGKPALFFGYVEFDADPTAPGGVPGFGPWPSLPIAISEAAR